MKKPHRLMIYLLFMALSLSPTLVQAFNPATHLYIAERVFPNSVQKIDLYYGSIAPDLVYYVLQPDKWPTPTAFEDTHYEYINLRPYAWGPTQRAFAKGWLTHNEKWGADYYAHINPGYVIDKASLLSAKTGIRPEFAHYAIEVAIDLLLKRNDAEIGEKLLKASLLRSWEDRQLLVKVLVLRGKRTDWLTLASAELAFRNLVVRYAWALALPSPQDEQTLARLGAQLAVEMGITTVSPDDVLYLLGIAVGLCEDYYPVIEDAIEGIKRNLGIIDETDLVLKYKQNKKSFGQSKPKQRRVSDKNY
jgi:hypothetical protein